VLDQLRDITTLTLQMRRVWERRTTIALVLAVWIVVSVRYLSRADIAEIWRGLSIAEIFIIAGVSLALLFSWWLPRRIPRKQGTGLCIAIGITCEGSRERKRLASDFVEALRNQMPEGMHKFELIRLSEYRSLKLSSQQAIRHYHRITRAHLIIYGACKLRKHHAQETYLLELKASVLHRTIPDLVQAGFRNEMQGVFPSRNLIPADEEVLGFTITRDLVSQAARYILGMASLLSLDPRTAFELHWPLWMELCSSTDDDSKKAAQYRAMRSRLPDRLITESMAIARHAYLERAPDFLGEMQKHISIVQQLDPNNYSAHLLRAIHIFLNAHDIAGARAEVLKARNERDSTWQLSLAFLSAYEGDLDEAHRLYKRAFHGHFDPIIAFDVESFILEVLEKEPSRVQLRYCLGMINYLYKQDLVSALKDFKIFTEWAEGRGSFPTSRIFAERLIREIGEKLQEKASHGNDGN
jgi:hypothetical protein